MDVLHGEQVAVDRMTAHGGLFRTPGTPQRLLAAALRVPVALEDTAGEGGAWGIAVLAAYLEHTDRPLEDFLADTVFRGDAVHVAEPEERDVRGFQDYLARYRAALPVQDVAAAATRTGAPADQAAATRTGAAAAQADQAAPADPDVPTDQGEPTDVVEARLQTEQEPTR